MGPIPFLLFMSYRRADTEGYAGWLHYCLEERYGVGSVFRDVGGIDLGAKFMTEVERAIKQCDGVLCVIGRSWATISDPIRGRRLDDDDDFVRRELETALRLGRMVVPVLIEGAPMPRADELPGRLKELTEYNGHGMSDAHWREDLERLCAYLDNLRASRAAGPKMTGADIVAAFERGTGAPTWVGRSGGLKGKLFREDRQTRAWEEQLYEVQFGGVPRSRNWFPVSVFIESLRGQP
jgi:hypothetical protein